MCDLIITYSILYIFLFIINPSGLFESSAEW